MAINRENPNIDILSKEEEFSPNQTELEITENPNEQEVSIIIPENPEAEYEFTPETSGFFIRMGDAAKKFTTKLYETVANNRRLNRLVGEETTQKLAEWALKTEIWYDRQIEDQAVEQFNAESNRLQASKESLKLNENKLTSTERDIARANETASLLGYELSEAEQEGFATRTNIIRTNIEASKQEVVLNKQRVEKITEVKNEYAEKRLEGAKMLAETHSEVIEKTSFEIADLSEQLIELTLDFEAQAEAMNELERFIEMAQNTIKTFSPESDSETVALLQARIEQTIQETLPQAQELYQQALSEKTNLENRIAELTQEKQMAEAEISRITEKYLNKKEINEQKRQLTREVNQLILDQSWGMAAAVAKEKGNFNELSRIALKAALQGEDVIALDTAAQLPPEMKYACVVQIVGELGFDREASEPFIDLLPTEAKGKLKNKITIRENRIARRELLAERSLTPEELRQRKIRARQAMHAREALQRKNPDGRTIGKRLAEIEAIATAQISEDEQSTGTSPVVETQNAANQDDNEIIDHNPEITNAQREEIEAVESLAYVNKRLPFDEFRRNYNKTQTPKIEALKYPNDPESGYEDQNEAVKDIQKAFQELTGKKIWKKTIKKFLDPVE